MAEAELGLALPPSIGRVHSFKTKLLKLPKFCSKMHGKAAEAHGDASGEANPWTGVGWAIDIFDM